MAKVNKQRDRFEKYSVLLRRFCRPSILDLEITRFFADKIVKELIEHDVFVLRDFLRLDKNKARSLFKSSDLFRDAVNVLNKLCEKEIPDVFNQYRVGKAYLLIEPFDILQSIIKLVGSRQIDYKYTDYSGVRLSLEGANIHTYLDLFNAGAIKVSDIKGFGEKGYCELTNIICGEKRRAETGEIIHTKKWMKTDKQTSTSNPSISNSRFNIGLIKQDSKIKQVHVNALKRINNHITKLLEAKETSFLNRKLKEIGASPYCYNYAYKIGLMTLNDIYVSINQLVKKYNYVQSRLKNLADNISKISTAHLKGVKKRAAKTNKTPTNTKKEKVKTNTTIINRIKKRTSEYCCLCSTFSELSKISEKDFVGLMKKQYPIICGYKLSKERVKSWRDEFNQLTHEFIPVLKKYDKNIMNFHVVFEMKMPMRVTDLEYEEFVYADAIIVGDDGFVVLEFKQRDSSVVDHFVTQAVKYIHRLRFHRIGRKQSFRYTYMVFTKETKNGVWCYDNKEDFWFGNSKSVAEDMCTQFFDSNSPIQDIGEWLEAGFKEKHAKH